MSIISTASYLTARVFLSAHASAGSLVKIDDAAVPTTAAAHCNIHWSILCIIGIYALYAALRAAYIKNALLHDETPTEDSGNTCKKNKGFCHMDTVIGIITLMLLCLSKFYWTCSVDYKVALTGAIIVIFSSIMMEILNYKLYHCETR